MFSYQKKGSYTYGSRDSVLHFFFQNSFFICFSFVIPLLIMFILFHSAVYDGIIGCQNLSAINTPIAKAVEKMKITRNLLYITKLSRQFLICPLRKILTMKKIISQYEYCKNAGFEYVQGYLFSKPIPYDMITNYFQKISYCFLFLNLVIIRQTKR